MSAGIVSSILVGVDGSEPSRRALTWAAGLAASLDAEVLAVHAAGLLEHLDQGTPGETRGTGARAQFETEWCAPLDVTGVRSRRLIVDGPPPLAMLRVASDELVDLIVVGSRGIGGAPSQVLGSTSLHLVQHSPVPVVVLPSEG